ncbi:hypothetical protein [Streptomyces sp. 5-10]|uniref:hypothetical protein n=1 Tax=Streptomyces sp. 5-10 TaxID=878925 RepID=UPI00168BDF53|nr:hypothetical protein [Streptomyces sp. 5-10]MBD3004687.1 hypothetical protein [Streptomyces sp. 5-10]
MAGKKTHTLTATFIIEHSDGPKVGTYDALAEYLATEWEGMEVYFQGAGEDDETSVNLFVRNIETSTETA